MSAETAADIVRELSVLFRHRSKDGKPMDARSILAYMSGYASTDAPELFAELDEWLEASRPYVEGVPR